MTTRLLNLINQVIFQIDNLIYLKHEKIVHNLKGILLPKPLNYIVDIVPLINSYETYTLLLNIWKYLSNKLDKDESIQVINEKINTDQLRNIFLKNLNKLGSLYVKFFKNT
jgi:hypothetical protein